PSLHRHYPASAVLRACPPPHTARPVPHGCPVEKPLPPTAGISRVASALLVPPCPRPYPGGIVAGIGLLPGLRRRLPSPSVRGVVSRVNRFEACSASTHVRACRLAGSPRDPFHRRLR